MSTRTVLVKRTSLLPKLNARLRNSDGSVIDLTGVDSVSFSMRRTSDDVMVVTNQVCSVVNAAQGIVEYAWQAGETDVAGAHIGDFRLVWSGVPEIIPTKGYVNVRVLNRADNT